MKLNFKAMFFTSAATLALSSVSLPAFALNPCGPLWVDKDGNRTKAYMPGARSNPNNQPNCELTTDNWNNDLSPNINDAHAQMYNTIWNNRGKNKDGSYDPGIGELSANDPHMKEWDKGNGQMKTAAERINENSDRIDTKQDRITDDQIAKAQSWVNGQIAKAAAGSDTPPSGGSLGPIKTITGDSIAQAGNQDDGPAADAKETADAINTVIGGVNDVRGVATAAQLASGTNAENIKANADNIAANTGNIAANKTAIAGKQDKITQAQIDAARTWVEGAIKAAGGGAGGDCQACDTIKKITDTDADGNVTAKDTTARGEAQAAQKDATAALTGKANDQTARNAAGKAQSTADKAQADATTALTGGADDQTARDGVAANAQRINEANQNIANAGAAARSYTDQTAAKTLASANAYTDSRYNQLDGKVKKLRARVDSGVAGATAIGTLAFDSLKANSIAGGLSVAKNKVAGAVGYQHNFNANWRARGTLAVSDNYVQGGASVGYSW